MDLSEKLSDAFVTPAQLDGDLVTLTLLPRSRWQTLLNLEVIQQRNKPKEPPKEPEKAPFFLPTLPGVEHRFAVQQPEKEGKKKQTKRLQKAAGATESVFMQKLTEEDEDGSCKCRSRITLLGQQLIAGRCRWRFLRLCQDSFTSSDRPGDPLARYSECSTLVPHVAHSTSTFTSGL